MANCGHGEGNTLSYGQAMAMGKGVLLSVTRQYRVMERKGPAPAVWRGKVRPAEGANAWPNDRESGH
jgi:hypothetical protein